MSALNQFLQVGSRLAITSIEKEEKMTEGCLSKESFRVDKILGHEMGELLKPLRGLPWGAPGLCKEIDIATYDFADLMKRRYELKENYFQLLPEEQVEELFHVLGFFFTLILEYDKRIGGLIKNFAERAPSEFMTWMTERENDVRRSKIHAVK